MMFSSLNETIYKVGGEFVKNLYLIELREERGLNQAQLADKLGISPSSMSAYELGTRIPRDEIKVKIAEFFGADVLELFFTNSVS